MAVPGARNRTCVFALSVLLCLSIISGFEVRPAAAQVGYMSFGAMDPRISYGIAAYDNQQVQDADLGMLVSTGASCIRTDIGYEPWLAPTNSAAISLVDSVVDQIRNDHECLIIADAASESYRAAPIPWAQFETAWVQRVQTLAQRYHPDYYIVVKEPRWYSPMISDNTTNPLVSNASEWVNLTQRLIIAVQAVSPDTKIGVSVDAGSLGSLQFGPEYDAYIQGVTKLPGLSFIGFDTYGPNDQAATQSYLAQYSSGGKDVWVSEAWSTPDGSALNGDPNQDATWMTSMYGFAQSINAKFLIPFYTDDFSSYTWDTNPTDIVANYNLREPVFGAFQSLVEQYGIPRTPTIAAALSSSSVAVGGSVFDSATLSGATDTAGGTVTYSYYTDGSCSGTATLVSQVTIASGSLPDSSPQTFTSPGLYSWSAVYSGDPDNRPATSACEPLTVLLASPTIAATVSPSVIVVGTSASDVATLVGAFHPTGSITFEAYSDSACTISVFTSINPLAGNSATSGSFTPASTGTYYWSASYPGDANNNAVGTPCRAAGETLAAGPRATATDLSCSPASTPVNRQTTCTVRVTDVDSGNPSTPSGSVTFEATGLGSFSSSSCSVVGTGVTATCKVGFTPGSGSEGQQKITADYLGDADHQASAGAFALAASKRSTSATLSCQSPPQPGKAVTCTVTVKDTSKGTSITPTGTATFTSNRPGSFSSSSCLLVGSGATAKCSVTFEATGTGRYTLKAAYGGDSDHAGSSASKKFTVR